MNKHVSALISYLTLVPLVYVVPDLVAYYVSEHKLINVMISVAVIVPLISYIVLPVVNKFNKKGSK